MSRIVLLGGMLAILVAAGATTLRFITIKPEGAPQQLVDSPERKPAGAPARLLLEIEVGELLPGAVLHDECGADVLDGARRREAARRWHRLTMPRNGPQRVEMNSRSAVIKTPDFSAASILSPLTGPSLSGWGQTI